MGFLDTISEFMDAVGIADPEKETKKNIENEAAAITAKAIKAAETIILLSDKDEMKTKILETLDEFYALGARAQLHIKEE